MDRSTVARRLTGESGFVTIEHLAAALLAMVFFALLANLVVMQYTMAAVTGALDEGVRQGARSSVPADACLERVDQAVGSLLGGPLSGALDVGCWVDGTMLRARADGWLPGWLPGIPDLPFTREAFAPIEGLP